MAATTTADAHRTTTDVDAAAGFGLSCYFSAVTETAWADAEATVDVTTTADAVFWAVTTVADANGLSGFC